MISLDSNDVYMEILAAEDLRKKHLVNMSTLVKRYIGNYYRSDSRGKPVPENMLFTFVATVTPQLIFDNPAVAVAAKRIITHEPIARYMQMWLNGWIKEVDLRTELELVAYDYLFAYGCIKVGIEPRGDYSTGIASGVEGRFTMDALSPFSVRISPANALIDSQCETWQAARILGHQFQRDLTDLQSDERYDAAAIAKLTADDERRYGAARGESVSRPNSKDNLRGRVSLYELYFPEHRRLGTLAKFAGGTTGWVRPPRPYHGPDEGPYVFFGCYVVPDQVYPYSPVAAMAEQFMELNAHAEAAARDAAAGKSIVLVDANNPELATEITNAPNGAVVKVKGLNAQGVVNLQIGGASPDRLNYLDRLLMRTDRIAGQSEAQRGRAAGVTATEATIVDAAADNRTEYIQLKYREGARQVLRRIGWYGFYDPAVVSVVSAEDPTTGAPTEGVFLGGIQEGQEDMNWVDFFLDIEPYSMRRIDPALQQQRAQMTVQLVTALAPMIPQFPYMNWPAILDMIGEANNIPDFAKVVLNSQGLMMIQAGVMPGQMGPWAGDWGAMSMQPPPMGMRPDMGAAAGGAPVGMMGRRFGAQAGGIQPAQSPRLPG